MANTNETAAQAAAAAMEAATESTNVQTTAAMEAATESTNVQTTAQVVNNESVDATIARILKDGHSYLAATTITAIDCAERTAKNGSTYVNAFITLNTPLKGAQKMPDNTVRMGMIGAFQTPFNQLLLVMRKHQFYGRYVTYVEEAANLGGAFAALYTAGTQIKVLCQFVPAGVVERNPFTRAENVYEAQPYDRYVYHIVGIEQPTDPVTVASYVELNKRIADDLREAIKARRAAKAAVGNAVAAAINSNDMPF